MICIIIVQVEWAQLEDNAHTNNDDRSVYEKLIHIYTSINVYYMIM